MQHFNGFGDSQKGSKKSQAQRAYEAYPNENQIKTQEYLQGELHYPFRALPVSSDIPKPEIPSTLFYFCKDIDQWESSELELREWLERIINLIEAVAGQKIQCSLSKRRQLISDLASPSHRAYFREGTIQAMKIVMSVFVVNQSVDLLPPKLIKGLLQSLQQAVAKEKQSGQEEEYEMGEQEILEQLHEQHTQQQGIGDHANKKQIKQEYNEGKILQREEEPQEAKELGLYEDQMNPINERINRQLSSKQMKSMLRYIRKNPSPSHRTMKLTKRKRKYVKIHIKHAILEERYKDQKRQQTGEPNLDLFCLNEGQQPKIEEDPGYSETDSLLKQRPEEEEQIENHGKEQKENYREEENQQNESDERQFEVEEREIGDRLHQREGVRQLEEEEIEQLGEGEAEKEDYKEETILMLQMWTLEQEDALVSMLPESKIKNGTELLKMRLMKLFPQANKFQFDPDIINAKKMEITEIVFVKLYEKVLAMEIYTRYQMKKIFCSFYAMNRQMESEWLDNFLRNNYHRVEGAMRIEDARTICQQILMLSIDDCMLKSSPEMAVIGEVKYPQDVDYLRMLYDIMRTQKRKRIDPSFPLLPTRKEMKEMRKKENAKTTQ